MVYEQQVCGLYDKNLEPVSPFEKHTDFRGETYRLSRRYSVCKGSLLGM